MLEDQKKNQKRIKHEEKLKKVKELIQDLNKLELSDEEISLAVSGGAMKNFVKDEKGRITLYQSVLFRVLLKIPFLGFTVNNEKSETNFIT